MRLEDGTIQAIYCHNDGYPGGVGAVLGGWYTDLEKVKDLIALGSLSCLEKELAPAPGTSHTFDKPQKNVTIAYHRDRNEDLDPGKTYSRIEEYEADGKNWFGAEYLYLFEDGIWKYFPLYGEQEWVKLEVIVGK